jgi:hypothetical protein
MEGGGGDTERRGSVSVRRVRRRRIEGFIVMDDPLCLFSQLLIILGWEVWKCADSEQVHRRRVRVT